MKSFDQSYKRLLLILPLVLGGFLLLIQILYETDAGNKKIKEDVQAYEANLRAIMVDEVQGAVYAASFYYEQNKYLMDQDLLEENIILLLSGIHSSQVGYFFASDYEGNARLGPGQGQNVFHVEDVNGLKVVPLLIDTAKAGGGFVEYVRPPLEGYKEEARLSYVMPFHAYDWYIGVGVSLDKIKDIEAGIHQSTNEKNKNVIIIMGVSILSLMVILAIVNNLIYKHFKHQVDYLHQAINRIDKNPEDQDLSALTIREFRTIGDHLRSIIQEKTSYQEEITIQNQILLDQSSQLEAGNLRLQEEIAAHEKSLISLELSKNRFKSMMHALPDAFFIINRDGVFTDCEVENESWLIEGSESFLGKSLLQIMPVDIADLALHKIHKVLNYDQKEEMEYDLDMGKKKYFKVHFSRYSSSEVVAILKDITDLKESQNNIVYLSYHDALTQTFNRRYFEEKIHHISLTEAYPLSLAIIDVNGLKLINDAFGHAAGDQLLKAVATILLSYKNQCDIVARTGGDEFALVFKDKTLDQTWPIIEKIQNDIHHIRFHHTVVSISIGLSQKEYKEEMINHVIARAEEKMYHNKMVESQTMRHDTIKLIQQTLHDQMAIERVHSQRVSAISKSIALAMDLPPDQVNQAWLAGELHDLGKITLDPNLLNKTTLLSESERMEIRKHPEATYRILKTVDKYASIADIVLHHHEHFDGQGYPRGLSGQDIPLISRILCVADAYEAMTSHRPYKTKVSRMEAMEELKDKAGSQFDPLVVEAFEKHVFDPF